MDTAEIMNACDRKRRKLGLKKLKPAERIVTLLSTLNFEVDNGGLGQFYYNDAGDDAVETVRALEKIGAGDLADALRAANALFPKGWPPKDRAKRVDAVRKLRSFRKFEQVFSKAKPDLWTRLESWILDTWS